jgi:hypothetical protein
MALPHNELYDYIDLTAHLANVTGTGKAFIPCPVRGDIVKLKVTRYATIAGADNIITTKINGTAITGGAITMPHASDAAGDTDEVTPTALNSVEAGDYIEFASGGQADDATVPVTFQAVIRLGRDRRPD